MPSLRSSLLTRPARSLASTLAALAIAPSALATGIGYDAITSMVPPVTVTQPTATWIGEDVSLAPGASLNVNSIQIRTWMSASATQATIDGFLRIRIYASQVVFPASVRPGEILWQADVSATWARGQALDVTAAIDGLNLPSPSVWIGWSFMNLNGNVMPTSVSGISVMQNTAGPVVGQTAAGYATSSSGISWTIQNPGAVAPYALRVNVLPSPGALALLGGAGMLAASRRRR